MAYISIPDALNANKCSDTLPHVILPTNTVILPCSHLLSGCTSGINEWAGEYEYSLGLTTYLSSGKVCILLFLKEIFIAKL